MLRILLADDHELMRRGLRALLESCGWEICAEAKNGREAVELATKCRPNIAILDVMMPELNGIDAARRILHDRPNTEILILSVNYSDQIVRQVAEVGVRGYVVKSDAERDLVLAVESLAKHKPFFTPLATQAVLSNFLPGSSPAHIQPIDRRLTSREREVVQLISEGKSSKEVAAALDISIKTAETHRANIMHKLEFHTTAQLVRYALRSQIIDP